MSKILVTGCAGFIGSATSRDLLNEGNEVIGVDNINNYYDIVLKEWRLSSLRNVKGFTFCRGDIEDYRFLENVFKEHKIDTVINLAARAGVRYSMENPFVYESTNVGGTLNLLECMKKTGVSKLVLASTSSLYAGQEMPFLESSSVDRPISPYAATKKAAEMLAYTYHYLYGIDVIVNRFFTVYGPAGRPDMSPFRFIRWIDEGVPITLYGDGTQSRDFTFIDDIARGVILSAGHAGFEIINLGAGNNPISINKMIGAFEQLLGKRAKVDQRPFNKSDMMHTWADISKAEKMLGWKPEIEFEEGMKLTVDWYQENKEWVRRITI